MSALESLIATKEAGLLESLTYDLPANSTAITLRRQNCRAFPTSASSLSYTGVRTARIRIGGNDWIDPASVRIFYTVQNTSTTANLCPVCGPWGPFGQVRLMCNGIELDNYPYYSRFQELHGWRLTPTASQAREAMFGWGSAWTGGPHPNQGFIPPNGTFTVSFRPLLSMFTQSKFIPARYCPQDRTQFDAQQQRLACGKRPSGHASCS